ncbi:MAG: acyl-CoA desaturase [bacterium]|nr:acyl-CoA desaturase [bacterium]
MKGKFQPAIAFAIIAVQLGAIYGIYYGVVNHGFSKLSWVLAIFLYVISSLGVSVGYHRYYTHEAFKCGRIIQFILTIMAGLAIEGPIWQKAKRKGISVGWRANHLQHHAYTDKNGDPHSPWFPYLGLKGFLWAHEVWLFFETPEPSGYSPDRSLEKDPIARWQNKWNWLIARSGFIVPFCIAGWDGLWLAGFVRVASHWNVTWSVNSVCHKWGFRALDDSGKLLTHSGHSVNNPAVAVAGSGEGWHDNHHVQPHSAHLGWKWYQIDSGMWLISFLEFYGLVWNVQRPKIS